MLGGQKCPWCGHYNPLDDRRCGKCERWVPPPPISDWLALVLSIEFPVTKLFVLLNVLVFGAELASAGSKSLPLFSSVPMSVLLKMGALTNGLDTSEPWRLVTSSFVHMSILHIVLNMMSVVDFGRTLEPQLGSGRFTLSYLFTGLSGFVLSMLWFGQRPYITAGASASVFGLIGVFLGALIMRKNPLWKDMLVRLILSSVILAYVFPVNNAAHIGGGVAGLLCGVLFSLETRPWKITPFVNIAAALAIVATLVCLVLPMQSPAWKRAREAEEWQRQQRELDRLLPDSW